MEEKLTMYTRGFYIGDIVQFYKRSLLSKEFKDIHKRRDLYVIVNRCYNLDNEEYHVVYQSLETGEMFSVCELSFCERCSKDLQSNQEYVFEKFPMGV